MTIALLWTRPPHPGTPSLAAPARTAFAYPWPGGATIADIVRTHDHTTLRPALDEVCRRLSRAELIALLQHPTLAADCAPFFDAVACHLAVTDPAALLRVWSLLPETAPRSHWYLPVAEGWSRHDPNAAASWLGEQPDSDARNRALCLAADRSATAGDPATALEFLRRIPPDFEQRSALVQRILNEAADSGTTHATRGFTRFPADDPDHLPALEQAAQRTARRDLQAAVDLVTATAPEPLQDTLIVSLVDAPAQHRPGIYIPWATENLSTDALDAALLRWLPAWHRSDPRACAHWLDTQCPPDVRARLSFPR